MMQLILLPPLEREMAADRPHMQRLWKWLCEGLRPRRLAGAQLHGPADRPRRGNVNMSFAYVEGELLIMGL